MPKKSGYSLVEILIVLVVIGILVALALPNYGKTKERSLDREARATLGLIRAAEKIYKMEQGFFYPDSGTESDAPDINSFLKLSIPTSSVNWTYSVTGTTSTGSASRSGRIWSLDLSADSDPLCAGANCP